MYDRPYLLDEFPKYDYNNALHAWEMDINRPDGPRNCSWQMQAFHYKWCVQQCADQAKPGISFDVPNLPFCLTISSDDSLLLRSLQRDSLPLIVASTYLQKIQCDEERCDSRDVRKSVCDLVSYIAPTGVIVAALLDDRYARRQGRSMIGPWGHIWSPNEFYNRIVKPLVADGHVTVIEFDTFKNGMSFNIVLGKGKEIV